MFFFPRKLSFSQRKPLDMRYKVPHRAIKCQTERLNRIEGGNFFEKFPEYAIKSAQQRHIAPLLESNQQ